MRPPSPSASLGSVRNSAFAMPSSDDTQDVSSGRAPLPLILAAGATLVCLFKLLEACAHGFDFTDESFYLVWIAHPFEYPLSVTQFGFIYHPLYVWLEGDIAALRRVNVLLTFGLASALSFAFVHRSVIHCRLGGFTRLLLAVTVASVASSSLVFNGLWLATPGYNSLCLQSLLLSAIGLLLASPRFSFVSICGWVLLGIGGALTFSTKPSSAAALAVISLFYVATSGKWRTSLVALSALGATLGVAGCALAIDGSLSAFQDRLSGGLAMASVQDSRYGVSRLLKLDSLHTGRHEALAALAVAAILLCIATLSGAARRPLARFGACCSVVLALTAVAVLLGVLPDVPAVGRLGSLLLFAVPLVALALVAAAGRLHTLPRPAWAIALTLLALPYAYGFGTANAIWPYLGQAALFAVLAGFALLAALPARRQVLAALSTFAIGAQLLSVLYLSRGMSTPYRQPTPLAQQTTPVHVGPRVAMLLLSSEFASYLDAARTVAAAGRFATGTPMLDLSGQSPGLLFALGARSIGQAWSIGGYPGSATVSEQMLRRASCGDLARAWLLVEPASQRALPAAVLDSFGANLSRDFEVLGTIATAPGASGRHSINQQLILKPLRSAQAATAACLAHRASST
jgi:hypothetical protein